MKPKTLLSLGGLLLLALPLPAQTFSYADRDVLAIFRRSGSADFEVNLGSISQFTSGLSLNLTSYTPQQFAASLGNAAGLSWTVLSAVRPGQGDAAYPQNTLWLTRPRTDENSPTSPFDRHSNSTQSQVSAIINGIAGNGSANGAKPWSFGMPVDPLKNTASVVAIPSDDPNSYTRIAGTVGNLNGTFGQGPVENTTPLVFSSGTSTSDFYELRPGSGAGNLLGSFQLQADGSLRFLGVPEPGTFALLTLGALVMMLGGRSFLKR